MRVFYDFEFLENGVRIIPISLGMVADNGQELYLINREAPWAEVDAHPWLRENVMPHLPIRIDGDGDVKVLDDHPDAPALMPTRQMAIQVSDFLADCAPAELWGYYSAYDHVALAQLYGSMTNLPEHIPMHTNDIMTLLAQSAMDEVDLPPKPDDAHNSLADARWNREAYTTITVFGAGRRLVQLEPYTMGTALCDGDGIVRGGVMHHGTDYPCTGSAHRAGEHILCTSIAHDDIYKASSRSKWVCP